MFSGHLLLTITYSFTIFAETRLTPCVHGAQRVMADMIVHGENTLSIHIWCILPYFVKNRLFKFVLGEFRGRIAQWYCAAESDTQIPIHKYSVYHTFYLPTTEYSSVQPSPPRPLTFVSMRQFSNPSINWVTVVMYAE